jgi:hypothetical protein
LSKWAVPASTRYIFGVTTVKRIPVLAIPRVIQRFIKR